MKTYNQFLTTPFSEEVKPEAPQPPKEDPSMKSKEKRQMQIKKQVLLKKMQAVRAGAGADIVAGYEPEGEVLDEADPRLAIYQSGMTDASRVKGRVGKAVDKVKDKVKKVLGKKDKVSSHLDRYRFQSGLDNYLKSKVKKEELELDERLGGKGYSRSTMKQSLHPPSRKSSGDWEDSDRGAGNKAKKRAGGKVEKKSPTYQAHVLNKESKTPEDIRAADKKWLERRGRKIAQNIKDKKPVKPRQDYGEVKEGVGRAAIGAALGSVAGPVGAAAGAAIGASLGKKKVTSGAGGKKKPKNFFKAEPKVTTSEDKAFNYVVAKLKKQYGDGVLTKGDKMPELSAAQKKKNAAIKAKRAKEDHRDATEKATSGRYNDRSRSD